MATSGNESWRMFKTGIGQETAKVDNESQWMTKVDKSQITADSPRELKYKSIQRQ